MTEALYREILRYLGYRSLSADENVKKRVEECTEGLSDVINPKAVYLEFPLEHESADGLYIDGLFIRSSKLEKNLKGCNSVYLMGATLGIEADRMIARSSARSMSDAVIYQASAAALIESFCDEVNEKIRTEARMRGLYCRPRFSPGYGDFALEHQKDIVRLLDAPRKIGLTVTESLLLVPVKSVTAVIGVSEEPKPCHIKGCDECEKTECDFRR